MSGTRAVDARWVRPLVTPEGVELSLVLADGGQRVAAFLLDVVFIVLALLALLVVVGVSAIGLREGDTALVIGTAGFFLVRNGYFAAFELTPRGATPGKRLLGLRVAARDGGRLTGDAILARNLVREVELFLPLTILAVQNTNAGAVLVVLGLGWTGILLLFPLFNRDRLRVGDLLAGTWVVQVPRPRLLADLVAAPVLQAGGALAFTAVQLRAYGIKELHVLEDVLRAGNVGTMAVVADRIRAKIGWVRGAESNGDFLGAYYAGLRGELERGLLFGRRRLDKFDA